MLERWAVICGLVRDEAAFLKKLSILAEWQRCGVVQGVVVSTWVGEIDRYPSVAKAFDNGAFLLVESNPPILKAPGHVLHQMKALYYGLQAVPKDAWVLKLRPDLGLLHDGIREAILDPGLDIENNSDWPGVLLSKILIAGCFIDQPFYINDVIFYGRWSDIQKLACFNISPEYVCVNTSPEQFFFRGPFAGCFPLIEAFMQIMPHFAYGDEGGAARRLSALLSSDFFLDVLALNLLFLKRYFRIGFLPQQSRISEKMPALAVSGLFDPMGRVPGVVYHNGANAPGFDDERALDLLLSGQIIFDELGERFIAALARVFQREYRENFASSPLTPHSSVRSLSRAICSAMPGMPHQLDERQDRNNRRFRIESPQERLNLAVATDETRRLEEEVNFLRREIDQLNAEKARNFIM